MSEVNQYGLSRDIPDPVKRAVRQKCGFGCVICGNAIVQYEHIDPEFAEAREHNPDCITLLCGYCHDRTTKRLLSKETVKAASLEPKCKQIGFSFGPFDIGAGHPEIVIGALRAKNVAVLLQVDGDDLLSVSPPERNGLPFLINARLFDTEGAAILDIVENEWRTPSANWDVELSGPRITIKRGLGDISLVLRSEPPHRLIVERMHLAHRGTVISCEESKDIITVADRFGNVMEASGYQMEGCKIAIQVIPGSIRMGVGGGTAYIRHAVIQSGLAPSPRVSAYTGPNTGRNAPCPCGSGKKFKRCHGSLS